MVQMFIQIIIIGRESSRKAKANQGEDRNYVYLTFHTVQVNYTKC